MIHAAAPFTCVVTAVHDGDTWRCASGEHVRAAGVDANELDGSCHTTCAPMPADAARAYVDRLIYRERLTCQPVDRSYRRVVAACVLPDGRRLECAVIAAGAAVRWNRYWVRYRMRPCA